MSINATLLIQIVAFAMLVWFINKYLWAPLSQIMEERQKKISDGLSAAEKGRKELDEAEKRAKTLLVEAKEQAQNIIAQADKRSNEIVEEAKATAVEEAERIRQSAQAEMEQEVNRARNELKSEVADLVIAGARQIIQKEVDAKSHDALISGLVEKL